MVQGGGAVALQVGGRTDKCNRGVGGTLDLRGGGRDKFSMSNNSIRQISVEFRILDPCDPLKTQTTQKLSIYSKAPKVIFGFIFN